MCLFSAAQILLVSCSCFLATTNTALGFFPRMTVWTWLYATPVTRFLIAQCFQLPLLKGISSSYKLVDLFAVSWVLSVSLAFAVSSLGLFCCSFWFLGFSSPVLIFLVFIWFCFILCAQSLFVKGLFFKFGFARTL